MSFSRRRFFTRHFLHHDGRIHHHHRGGHQLKVGGGSDWDRHYGDDVMLEPMSHVKEDNVSFEAVVDLDGFKAKDISVTIERNGYLVRVVATRKNNNNNASNNELHHKVDKTFCTRGAIDTMLHDSDRPTATLLHHGVLIIKAKKFRAFRGVKQILVSGLVENEMPTVEATTAATTAAATTAEATSTVSGLVSPSVKVEQSPSSDKNESERIDVKESKDVFSSPVTAHDVATVAKHNIITKDNSTGSNGPAVAVSAATVSKSEPIDEKHNTLAIRLPGVRLQDLRVQLEDGGKVLRISGVRAQDQFFEQKAILRHQCGGAFEASLVHANLSSEVLTVKFPRRRRSISSKVIVPVVEESGADVDGVEAIAA